MSPDDPRHGTKRGYVAGCRCQPCTAGNTRAHKLYLLGRSPRLIDATGSRRRIRALMALGWTNLEIAQACGRTTREWSHYVATNEGRIREDVAADVANAYDRMSMTLPEGKYRARGRTQAARKGWLPPLAWTDIDDPNERPDLTLRDDLPDPVVVERILAGDWRLRATKAERAEVIERFPGSDNELERLTGWNVARDRREMSTEGAENAA